MASVDSHAIRAKHFLNFQGVLVFSGLADGIYRVALPLIALSFTRSPETIGIVTAVAWLPWLFIAVPAGALTDRSFPLGVMRYALTSRILIVLLMAFASASGVFPLWGLVVGAFLVGSAGVVSDIAAQATIPRLVEVDALTAANSRTQAIQIGTVQLLGPALAGYVVLLGSFGTFSIVGAGYMVALVFLFVIPSRIAFHTGKNQGGLEAPITTSSSFGIGEGIKYFLERRDILILALLGAMANFTFIALTTLLPLWAVSPGPINLTSSTYGMILTSSAFGGVLGGLVSRRLLAIVGERGVFFGCISLLAGCVLLLLIPSVGTLALGLMLYGMLILLWNVASVTYRQRTVPTSIFSRVNSIYRLISWGAMPFGALISGLVAGTLGIPQVFIGLSVSLLLISGISYIFFRLHASLPLGHDDKQCDEG